MDKCEKYRDEFGDGFCHEEYPPRSCRCEGDRTACERGNSVVRSTSAAELLEKAYGISSHAEKENSVKKIRQEVLEKAIHMVCGDREYDYGAPEQSLSLIGRFWEAYVEAKCVDENGKVRIDGADASAMMVLFKMARVATGAAGKEDNWVDACGYAANGAEIQRLMGISK